MQQAIHETVAVVFVIYGSEPRVAETQHKPLVGLSVNEAIAQLDGDPFIHGVFGPFYLNGEEVKETDEAIIRIGSCLEVYTNRLPSDI